MQPNELLIRLASKQPPVVLDVRSGFEFRNGHIENAVHAPAWKLLTRLVRIPSDKYADIVVTCEHGPRAQMAQGLLGFLGYRNVTLLDGHMHGWRRAGLKIV